MLSSRSRACLLPSAEPRAYLAGLLPTLSPALPWLTSCRRGCRGIALSVPSLFTMGRGRTWRAGLAGPYFFLTSLRVLLARCAAGTGSFPEASC